MRRNAGESLGENHLQQINDAVTNLITLKTAQDDYNALLDGIQTLTVLKQAYLDVLVDSPADTGDEG